MIQVKSSGVSLSYNDLETKELNEILSEIQTKFQAKSETIKGLFLESLRMGLNALNSSSTPTNTEELDPKILELTEELEKSNLEFGELTKNNAELVTILEKRMDDVSRLNSRIQELEDNQEVETIEIQKEWEQTESDIFLPCTPIQVEALKRIAQNRLATKRETELLSISAMARKLLFNKATLFNYGGEMWTGLKRSEGKDV